MAVVRAVLGTVSTIIASLSMFLVLPFSPSGRLGALVTHLWGKITLPLMGVRLRTERAKGIGKGPYLVVANHASMLDIPTTAAAVPVRFHFVSRPFFFKVPILGWGMWGARHMSLDPKKPREAARALRRLDKRFAKGLSVLLFPEGTRSPDGDVHPYKRGPFLTAISNGVPILPVALAGTNACLPKGSLRPRPGRLRAVVGAPIATKDLGKPDAKRLAKDVEEWTRARVAEGV